MTAITTAAHIDAQTQEDLMRQAGIWIEHSTLIEGDMPARPLAAVQAEKHQLDRYTQLVAARAGAAPVAVAPQGVVAWMHPETLNVISAAHKHDMSTEYGAETRRKAESYSVALVCAGEPAAPAAPLKATPEMRAAFRRAYREGGFWDDRLDYALDQMLAAAPQAPAAPVVPAGKAHDWRESASYGGEICAECGAAKGSRRGNAPCAWPPAKTAKRWPFAESPGEFTARLEAAIRSFGGLLPAVRNVLIEHPPTLLAAPAAPAVDTAELGEWVATLEVDSEGGLDYETVPPCTLPPGCYRLYRAAQAKEGGAAA